MGVDSVEVEIEGENKITQPLRHRVVLPERKLGTQEESVNWLLDER